MSSEEEEDFGSDEEEEEEEKASSKSNKRKSAPTNLKKTKKLKPSFIDDAAELSGSDIDSEEEEEEEEEDDNEDYIRDGFVVDEEEVEKERKLQKKLAARGDLVDSDDEEDEEEESEDSEDDDSDEEKQGKGREDTKLRTKKKTRIRKLDAQLDEDDLLLIRESKGEDVSSLDDRRRAAAERQLAALRKKEEMESRRRRTVVAQSEKELRKGLFNEEEDDYTSSQQQQQQQRSKKKPIPNNSRADEFDEDALDDFIEDDLAEEEQEEEDYASARRRRRRTGWGFDEEEDDLTLRATGAGISEAQWNEANEIFGMDYAQVVMEDEQGMTKDRRYRERGVGVDMAGESEDELSDPIVSDDDDDLFEERDRHESAKYRREARDKMKQQRHQQRIQRQAEKRRALLKRHYEPIVLIENFCTPMDDEIRKKDIPERFQLTTTTTTTTDMEEDENADALDERAMWILSKIPSIASEFFFAASSDTTTNTSSSSMQTDLEEVNDMGLLKHQKHILESIQCALKYIQKEKLEPEFIRKYRADYVTSKAVREHLYDVMDRNVEWNKIQHLRNKGDMLLTNFASTAKKYQVSSSKGRNHGEESLHVAREKLEEAVQQEAEATEELQLFQEENPAILEDDDDIFEDNDEDDEKDEEDVLKEEKKKQLKLYEEKLEAVRALVQDRAERVAALSMDSSRGALEDVNTSSDSSSSAIMNKLCLKELWSEGEYRQYLSTLTEERQVADVTDYLQLVQEGNEAVLVEAKLLVDATPRSKRHDRDYYRTFVAKGMRPIAYRFMLSPLRAGIKLDEQALSFSGDFNYQRRLADDADNSFESENPALWVSPQPEIEPDTFAAELVSSGELVVLTQKYADSDLRVSDPLHGCRYVAAMEMAYEPRIRKQLREIYRKEAVLTTTPTKMGLATIDTFHEHYGLHLIRQKPIRDHFADDFMMQQPGIDESQKTIMMEGMRRKEKESCLQFLRAWKAHLAGFITLKVHLPDGSKDDINWFKSGKHSQQGFVDLSPFTNVLEPLYLFSNNGLTSGLETLWQEEKKKVIKQALNSFLFPLFEEEVMKDLAAAAIKFGVAEAASSLQAMAFEGPYRPNNLLGENRFIVPTGELPFVGVSVGLDSREATFLAAVSARGELKSSLAIPAGKQVTDLDMHDKVVGFLMSARPSAVVVGTAGGILSRLLNRKLSDIVNEATEKWNNRLLRGEDEDDEEYGARKRDFENRYGLFENYDDQDGELWKCNVDLIDDNVAQLFGRSVRGTKEFPDAPVNLKCAISIARHAQDPLAELCYAWSVASDTGNFGVEMLSMNVHPLQRHVPRAALLRSYERALCRAVAEVGVDVNAACTLDHKHGVLQFVPGFGPRKAANLKQNVARMGGSVPSRKYLLAKRLLGPLVYNNSVAFLRIRVCDQLSVRHINPLDDTRLHPDVYIRNTWANKIAVDALEEHVGGIEEQEAEEIYIRAVRAVMVDSKAQVKILFNATKKQWENAYGPTFSIAAWDPHNLPAEAWQDKVEELDLDAFAEMIEDSGLGKWLSHLTMIKWEFRFPFEDPRKPMEPLGGEKLFHLLTGENDWTLRPGKEVTGKVVKNVEYGSRIKLEGDIPGYIPIRNLADERVEAVEDVLSEGNVVTAIIVEVKKDHVCVDLSLRMEDFRKSPASWERPKSLPPLDACFDVEAAALLESARSKEREAHLAAIQALLQRKKNADASGTSGVIDMNLITRSGLVTRRACAHPAFRNASNAEVNDELYAGGVSMVGEALLRPSSKQCDTLALHWVVRPGVIKIIEVSEDNKDTDASIGNILRIKDEEYGSIDELFGRYVAPLNERVDEISHHRKFLNLPESEVDDKLRQLKKKTPTGIFYFLCWSEKYSGYASLRYIIKNTPRDHPIAVAPEGFVWGAITYKHVDKLLLEFKKNPSGLGRGDAEANSMKPPPPPVPAKPSRWGARPAPPPFVPPPPPLPPTNIGWGVQPPPPTTGWVVPST